MKETLACLTDIAGLRTCGFGTVFNGIEVCDLTPEHASVRYQDASSGTLGNFADLLVGIRAGSLAESTYYYPIQAHRADF